MVDYERIRFIVDMRKKIKIEKTIEDKLELNELIKRETGIDVLELSEIAIISALDKTADKIMKILLEDKKVTTFDLMEIGIFPSLDTDQFQLKIISILREKLIKENLSLIAKEEVFGRVFMIEEIKGSIEVNLSNSQTMN